MSGAEREAVNSSTLIRISRTIGTAHKYWIIWIQNDYIFSRSFREL